MSTLMPEAAMAASLQTKPSRLRAGVELGLVTALFWGIIYIPGLSFGGPLAVLACVAVITVLLMQRGESWKGLGLRLANSWKAVGAGAVAVLGIFLSVMIASAIAQPIIEALLGTMDRTLPDVSTLSQYLIMMAIVWTTAAIGEELVFRGFMMTRVSEIFGGGRYSWIPAAILPAMIFGLAHAYQGLPGILLTGTVGFVFGIWYIIGRRNLVPLIIAHGLVNTVGITLLHLAATGVIAAEF